MRWDKARVVEELLRTHRQGRTPSSTGQREPALRRAARRYFGSYRKAIQAAGLPSGPAARPRARWDKARVAGEFKKRMRAGEDLGSRSLRRTNPPLHAAAVHWFGSYRAAIEAAGIDYGRVRHQTPNRWNPKTIVQSLRRRQRERRPLHHAAVQREAAPLMSAAYRHFGNYRKAIAAAGIDYPQVRVRPRRVWGTGKIVAELRRLRREGSDLAWGPMKRSRPGLVRAAARYFGAYAKAARAAGIDPERLKRPPFRYWSPARVIEELQRTKREGEPLAPQRVLKARPSFYHICARRFGSYRRALEAAGIEYASVARALAAPMPSYVVTAKLRGLHSKGKDLRYSALNRSDPRLLDAARRRFGSYAAAMRAAGLLYPPKPPLRHWTEKLVLQRLRQLHNAGESLRYSVVKTRHMPLFHAAKHYFGSFSNAVKEAKLDQSKPARTQAPLRGHTPESKPRKAATPPAAHPGTTQVRREAVTGRKPRRPGPSRVG